MDRKWPNAKVQEKKLEQWKKAERLTFFQKKDEGQNASYQFFCGVNNKTKETVKFSQLPV